MLVSRVHDPVSNPLVREYNECFDYGEFLVLKTSRHDILRRDPPSQPRMVQYRLATSPTTRSRLPVESFQEKRGKSPRLFTRTHLDHSRRQQRLCHRGSEARW